MFESDFFSRRPESCASYQEAVTQAVALLQQVLPDQPYRGRSPDELAELLTADLDAQDGKSLGTVLRGLEPIIQNSVIVSHPATVAHLHCPPLIAALVAEVVLSALNQSMDSFDQAPAATLVEQALLRLLCRQGGLPATADGTFTAGGSQSNFMGLWLARDAWLQARWNCRVQRDGLPAEARRLRILCSEMAHFTIEKAAAQLGLGMQSVIKVATDDAYRMCPRALTTALNRLWRQELYPLAIVATAGTTDFGSIDPLCEIARLAQSAGAWFHVDAAYGGAVLFSERHRTLLEGLALADSVSMDFHKLLWQSISCGVFLVRDVAHFELMRLHAAYLNPEDHEQQGIPDLVTRSVLTTRRFDALKLWVSLQVLGRKKLGAMIDRTLELAQEAARLIAQDSCLELLHQPTLGCVVFRYRPIHTVRDADVLNTRIRHQLLQRGQAVIGHTRIRGRTYLKLTLINPCMEPNAIQEVLSQIKDAGLALEQRAKAE
jgi:L-2,4-diaminobutyrate decarboxylase